MKTTLERVKPHAIVIAPDIAVIGTSVDSIDEMPGLRSANLGGIWELKDFRFLLGMPASGNFKSRGSKLPDVCASMFKTREREHEQRYHDCNAITSILPCRFVGTISILRRKKVEEKNKSNRQHRTDEQSRSE